MAGVGLLHGINGESPDRIDAQLIDVLLAHCVSLADQGKTAMWVQGLDAAPADKTLNCTAKKAWLFCVAGVPAILACSVGGRGGSGSVPGYRCVYQALAVRLHLIYLRHNQKFAVTCGTYNDNGVKLNSNPVIIGTTITCKY
jgi:hypothetical protein